MVFKVVWPSIVSKQAEVWRVLDLSGLTKSVRESRNYLKAGFVFLNNNQVFTLSHTVEIGVPFVLELRFPNGILQRRVIELITPTYYRMRQNAPTTRNYRNKRTTKVL